MENTCSELLGCCLRGEAWPSDLLDRAIAVDDGRALLSIVVERLGDLFEPRLCETYERLFTEVIARVAPELRGRIRQGGPRAKAPADVRRVYVLSRVTLGADIAVTSVLLDAAKRRYPSAEIVFVGPRKSYELFQADARVQHQAVEYARGGSLIARLRASAGLWFDDGIVIDPDSRLSQLGLISVCDPDRYFFFPSRAYGGEGGDPLPVLAAKWAAENLGVADARPYLSPVIVGTPRFDITISLGIGDNPAKGLGLTFERELIRALTETGKSILIDKGGSAEEHARVEQVLLPEVETHDGAFAAFATHILRSGLFVGYDSAAGHVASAAGIPLVSIFAGFASERMLARWRPNGTVIRGDAADPIGEVRRALAPG